MKGPNLPSRTPPLRTLLRSSGGATGSFMMSHLHRFYIDPDTDITRRFSLSPWEAHHALHGVRIRAGDPVALFDGAGREFLGIVVGLNRRDVVIEVQEERPTAFSPVRLTLVQGWLHRDKSVEDLIRRGTELGIGKFVFFRGERSERPPKTAPKWRRIAIESCKQCGRSRLPVFETVPDLEAALENPADTWFIAVADPDAPPLHQATFGAMVALLVGPEGDFSARELALAHAKGAIPLSLGPRTFRAEVASLLASALILYELGDLGPQPAQETGW